MEVVAHAEHNAWWMTNIHYMYQVFPKMMMIGNVSLGLGAQALDLNSLVLNPSSPIYQL